MKWGCPGGAVLVCQKWMSEWLDRDLDGVGNNADPDDDGLTDEEERLIGTNLTLVGTDSDGVGDAEDIFPLYASETKDSDLDGIGDNADTDDDNDGFSDEEELADGTDPQRPLPAI